MTCWTLLPLGLWCALQRHTSGLAVRLEQLAPGRRFEQQFIAATYVIDPSASAPAQAALEWLIMHATSVRAICYTSLSVTAMRTIARLTG